MVRSDDVAALHEAHGNRDLTPNLRSRKSRPDPKPPVPNGGRAVRQFLDDRFQACGGWTKKQTGDIDWEKCHTVNGTRVCIGVEIQVSGRSDSGLFADIAHLRRAFATGRIDVGVIVAPSDRLGYFLTDRAPRMSDAKRHIEEARAFDLPILLFAIEHDGPGERLAKQKKKKMLTED